MKLVMTLLVRNEEDIIRDNIRYHLAQGVDFFIVTNNGSTDATPRILQEYEEAGCLFREDVQDDTFDQGHWVTRMARRAATEYGADWIIHNDADEFWWPARGSLKSTFAELPADVNVVTAARNNVVFTPRPWYRWRHTYLDMIYRERVSQNVLGLPLPAKVAHRAHPDVVMPTGNHFVENIGPQTICRDIVEIFHYPVRSRRQFLNKLETGIAPVMRHIEKHPGSKLGTWKHLHQQSAKTGSGDEMLRQLTYDGKRIRKELRENTIIRDTRLRNYFRRSHLNACTYSKGCLTARGR